MVRDSVTEIRYKLFQTFKKFKAKFPFLRLLLLHPIIIFNYSKQIGMISKIIIYFIGFIEESLAKT